MTAPAVARAFGPLPKHAPHAADVLPAYVLAAHRWAPWRVVYRKDKVEKIPIPPFKTNSPENWLAYADAVELAGAEGADGVGYIINGDSEIIVLDLDKVVRAVAPDGTPMLTARGERIMRAVGSDVYADLSQGLRGIRVLARRPPSLMLAKDAIRRFSDPGIMPDEVEGIEVYTGATAGRFATVTGWTLPGRAGLWAELPEPAIAAIEAEGVKLERVGEAGAVERAGLAPAAAWTEEWEAKFPHLLALQEYREVLTGDVPEGQRSERVGALLAFMLGRGHSQEDAVELLLSAPGTAEYLSKHGRRAERFAREEVGRAAAYVAREKAASEARNAAPPSGAQVAARALVDAAESAQGPVPRFPPLTDAGNAERFVHRNREIVRYVHRLDRWALWDGARWAFDDTRQVYGLAKRTARAIFAEAEHAPDAEGRKAVVKHATTSERRERLEAMLALARTMPPAAILPDDLDRDPDLFNVQNGTVDLRTGELRPHDPVHLLSKAAPVHFDPAALAPTWLAFLEAVIPEAKVREYLQRAVGYTLTGGVQEHALFFCYGTGANGKSTFLETVRDLMGEREYARGAAPDLLLAKRVDRHESEIVDLQGARFVTTVEVGEGRAWDEAKVKWLTGGDVLTGRPMYGTRVSFNPTHKFWIAANHRPRVRGVDHGFWRRVHFIPFTVTIPKERQDPDLRAKLRRELPGVLAWAVRGALEWRCTSLCPPDAVLAATADYRAAEDVLGAFIEEHCALNATAKVYVGPLYETFRAWAQKSGEKDMTKRAFGDALEERGFSRDRDNTGRFFKGLRLTTPTTEGGAAPAPVTE